MTRRFRILVVDDEQINIRIMLAALRNDYDVLTAVDGQHALDLLKEQTPDLILLDVMMPGLNGFQVCSIIKEDERLAGIPVLFLTAMGTEAGELQGLRAGGIDYITKPINFDMLRLRLKNHITMKVQRDLLARQKEELARALAEQGVQNRLLAETEARNRAILETAMDGFWRADLDGRLLEVNDSYCTMSGYSEQELLEMCVSDLEENESEDAAVLHFRTIMEVGRGRFESRHRRKDGSMVNVEVSCHFQDIDGGQWVCFLRDITERKRNDEYRNLGRDILLMLNEPDELKTIMWKTISLVKQVTGMDALCIRFQEGDDFPILCQDGFSSEFLLRENSLLRRNSETGICRSPEGGASLECTCGLVVCERIDPADPCFTPNGSFWTNDSFQFKDLPCDSDARINPRNECIHQGYASVALIPLRAKGRVIGLLQLNATRKGAFNLQEIRALEGIADNIGEAMLRKRAEEEKVRLEAQLQQAQKMESVGRLAGGVAHDFNNLLTVILGYAELGLNELEHTHPFYPRLAEILKAAEKSASLTQQLLAFARKQTVAPKVLDLNETVENVLKMLRRLIGEDIYLAWQPAGSLWKTRIDPSQIDQILANLCVNARDAIADTGIITIETSNCTFDPEYCSTHLGSVAGNYVMLAVSDNGCGIEREVLDHIFEPFFTTKGLGQGTGLGLATVYGIVKQNEGFINVYSEPGRGTTFRIYLPRHERAEAAGTIESARPLSRGSETVLLVEDEPSILNLTTLMLQKQGYTVLAAGGPVEALAKAERYRDEIRLVVTDVVMPEMNGRDLARHLQTLCPNIRCLFMSGYTANVIAHHGVLDEDVHFISKPFSLPDLIAKVRDVLDSKTG